MSRCTAPVQGHRTASGAAACPVHGGRGYGYYSSSRLNHSPPVCLEDDAARWFDLGFDTNGDFHELAIDWRPDRVTWLVDGNVVHERASWDPTPIPHLGMRVHANLWAPRSHELAGRINDRTLPASAAFRNVLVAE